MPTIVWDTLSMALTSTRVNYLVDNLVEPALQQNPGTSKFLLFSNYESQSVLDFRISRKLWPTICHNL